MTIEKIFFDRWGGLKMGWGIALIIVGIILIVMLAVGGVALTDSKICHEKWDAVGVESDYGFWTGCLVEQDGQMIPEDVLINNVGN